MKLRKELGTAIEAARRAGACLRRAPAARGDILSSAGRDIKLGADREAEDIILAALAPSGRPVLAEESGEHGRLDATPFWVVDPLDGSLNFSRGLPLCCVSIGLCQGGEPVLGVVYDFERDEMFTGIVDEGAWHDDRLTSVSTVGSAREAVLATGFPVNRDFGGEALADFVRAIAAFKRIRLLGSAALSLAYLASGRVDAYAEDDIMFWDVAAGIALVRAAGGFVTIEDSPRLKWAKRVRGAADRAIWRLGADP